MKKYIVLAALLSVAFYGFAQDVNKLVDGADVTRIIKTLSADDMQGRATFTPGIEKAAQFIESEYKQTGLEPLKGNTGYRQNFSMVRSVPVKMQATINNGPVATDDIFIAASNSFNWVNNGNITVETIGAGKNFVQEYMGYMHGHKKAIVFVDSVFAPTFKRVRNRILSGSVSFKSDTGRQVVFILGKYNALKAFEVNYTCDSKELPLFNVAGMIPGKTKPNEYVVFSGHYDHLGILKPMEGDSIANGADDDASGTTAVITLAKYYKKLNNNARTLIFVAFTAEEIGEYGSQYFAKSVDPDKVVAMFNIEMIGKASKFGENSAFITGYDRSDFGHILQKNLVGTSFQFYPDPYPAQDLFYRSDNASLAEVGVPAHTISTDQIDIDKYYHTVKDEFSTLDMANIIATIKAIALSSRTIVSGVDTPTRVAKVEADK